MVDKADIPKIAQLSGERNSVVQTLKLMDEGGDGRIIRMTYGKRSETEPKFWQFTSEVNTEYMDYPVQMSQTIRAYLVQRRDEIAKELSDLGVTGIDEPGGGT